MKRFGFRYLNVASLMVVTFGVVWSCGWLSTLNPSGEVRPSRGVNFARVPDGADASTFWIMLAIGLASLGGTICLIAFLVNHRVEVDGEEVREFNGWGRVTVRGSLKSAVVEETGAGEITIVTDGGSIKVGEGIGGFGELRALVKEGGAGPKPARFPGSAYVPPTLTLTRRWTFLHLVSFLLVGGVLYLTYKAWEASVHVATYVFLAGVLAVGVCMQLVGWGERVRLGSDGIEWIDFLGRRQVRASLEEIVGTEVDAKVESVQVKTGAGSTMIYTTETRIHTLRGTVVVHASMRGKERLLAEVGKLVAGR